MGSWVIPAVMRLDAMVLKEKDRLSLPMLALMAISQSETMLTKTVGVVSI